MNKELRKKLLLFGGIAVGIIVVILLIVWIVSLLKGDNLSYDKIEETMKNAAIEYYKVHSNLLPIDDTEISVDTATLAATEFMEPLDKLVKKGVSCKGEVLVKKNGDDYSYTPFLDCGKDYYSIELYKEITSKNIVAAGSGLYQINDEYVYRGEDVNNYVKIGDHIWRIVRVTSNHEVELILSNSKLKYLWDDRYNVEKKYNVGINDYSVSRIRSYLDELYQGDTLFTESQKQNLVEFPVCYGKRSEEDTTKDGSIECATSLLGQKIALLPIYQYLLASIDASCQSASDPQCQNYNYLATENANWWTLTGPTEDTYHVYSLSSSGDIDTTQAVSSIIVRPVVHLSSLTKLKSGEGTLENPYIIK